MKISSFLFVAVATSVTAQDHPHIHTVPDIRPAIERTISAQTATFTITFGGSQYVTKP